MQGSHMCLVETLEFQTSQRSEASFSFSAQYFRMANYSEVVGSTDLIFGMQGSLMGVVETMEFQRPVLAFQMHAKDEVCRPNYS